VDDMSAQPISPTNLKQIADQCDWVVRNPGANPYTHTPTEVLADSLENQWERGEPFCEDMVWEVINRALEVDELRRRSVRE
jgi:hypothetical protein